MLLIYTTNITSRFEYITKTLFGDDVILTNSKENFLQHHSFKINYSAERISSDELWIQPHGLLEEKKIQQQNISCFEWNGLKAFFKTEGDITFDILSASFYLITRYEEYLPHELDEHGRYNHTNSLAYKENFLRLPLINLWLKEIQKQVSSFKFQVSSFEFIPTYDIDVAYAYLHRSLARNVIGFFKDFLKTDFDKFLERGNVHSGRMNDPFDTFDWLNELHEKYNLKPIYFFLTILKRAKYDENLSASSKALQQLYFRLSKKYKVGLHPSWKSGDEESLLKKEKQFVEKIIKQPISISRNHYLRFTIPHTYRRLINEGMKEEYSMAYGSVNGFRASYTLPFYWYDLENEKQTDLLVHPFCFMEASAYFHEKLSVNQAAEELQYFYDIVKSINGEFITLFHNHFLTEQKQWLPWRKMYEDFIEKNTINQS